MKTVALAALMLALPAHADTSTLAPIDCGVTKQCVGVPNDTGADIGLYLAPQYAWLNVIVDGVHYYAPAGNSDAISSVVLTATDGSGRVVTLSATFGTYRTCNRSGRGQTCSTHYNLTSGSVVR